MATRKIEIEDTLQDCVDSAIDSIKDELKRYLESNPDTDSCPEWGDLDYSGALHEIVDGAVPIYTQEIRFYFHGDDIEQAFDDAGIGSKDDAGWPMGWKPAAIYCYIEQEAQSWFRDNAEDIFQEWKDAKPSED